MCLTPFRTLDPQILRFVEGIVGCAGLLPTVEAIKKKKTIALANKETLIAGGPAVLPLLQEHGVDMIPADSEHSAIFQCLQVTSNLFVAYDSPYDCRNES